MNMNEHEPTKSVLELVGIDKNDIDGQLIPRETLLSDQRYDEAKHYIPALKQYYSSSFMTSMQKNAASSQKWPLLNLVRQLLNVYGYKMDPVRKADGYTLDGIKRYKRYFQVTKKLPIPIHLAKTKKNELTAEI
jgi:hypothetical protein